MARFKFVGNGDNDPEEVVTHGQTFKAGTPVTVSDDVAEKLRANSHFEEVKRGNKK